MIAGFKRFEAAFLPYRESFILIGGTAVFKIAAYLNLMAEFAETSGAVRRRCREGLRRLGWRRVRWTCASDPSPGKRLLR